ncbi:MAG: hypothetical protein ACK5ES_05000, partial [Planctomyces sp.]
PPRPVPIASARARTRNRKEWFRPYEQGFSRLNPTVQCVSATGTQQARRKVIGARTADATITEWA